MAHGITRTKKQKDEMVEMLKPYLTVGMSVTKACKTAGLPKTTITDYIRLDEEKGGTVRLRISAWQNYLNARAMQNIAMDIAPELDDGSIPKGNVNTSQRWVDTRMSDCFDNDDETNVRTAEQQVDFDEAVALLDEMA